MLDIISKLEIKREHKRVCTGLIRLYTILDKGLVHKNQHNRPWGVQTLQTLIQDRYAATKSWTPLTANTCFLTNLPPCCKWGLKVLVTQITVQGQRGIKVLYLKVKNFKPLSWFPTWSCCCRNGLPARLHLMHFKGSRLVPWSWGGGTWL